VAGQQFVRSFGIAGANGGIERSIGVIVSDSIFRVIAAQDSNP
jgi:hypothetical protein